MAPPVSDRIVIVDGEPIMAEMLADRLQAEIQGILRTHSVCAA